MEIHHTKVTSFAKRGAKHGFRQQHFSQSLLTVENSRSLNSNLLHDGKICTFQSALTEI
jgi:hypothetical protein